MQPIVTKELIIKKIRKFNKDKLLENLFFHLKYIDINGQKNHPLWRYLLLIKWCFLEGNNIGKKKLTKARIITLLKYIEKFENKTLNPYVREKQWGDVFQIMGYQQFYLQHNVHTIDFIRQVKLFGNSLEGKYNIKESFKLKTGLDIIDFIFFMNIVWMYTKANELKKEIVYTGYIGEEIFEIMKEKLNYEEEFKVYVHLLTLNEFNIKKKIISFKTGIKSEQLQVFENSFFTQHPFVKNSINQYEIVHRSLFNYSCNYFIYDYLKNNDDKFTTEFGQRFEKYVELGLNDCGVDYITEAELRIQLGKKERVVDYVVENKVVIECKGVEPKAISSVFPKEDIVYNSFKDSIFKAYLKQMLNVVKLKKDLSTPLYGIIVTYKYFYLSSLNDYRKVIENEIEQICKQNNWDDNPLPPENVFIISIDDWDAITHLVSNEKTTFSDLLKNAVDANKIEKKWFSLFLNEYGYIAGIPAYLNNENQVLNDRLKNGKV